MSRPESIPELADAVYAEVAPTTREFLDRFVPAVFPTVSRFYYEQAPNVRFHIPYDLARPYTKSYNDFAKSHGQGKIAAHGPHRDSWLSCPSNGMNLWFAMGRIRPGNGMTVFPRDYVGDRIHKLSGDLADGERLHGTATFDLEPGDVIMFHTDQLHGSSLNRTDETRFAISCRLTIDRPKFDALQVHPYVYSGWDDGWLRSWATLPAKAQPSFFRSAALRLRNRVAPRPEPATRRPEVIGVASGTQVRVALDDVPVGSVRGSDRSALCRPNWR